MEQTNLPSNPAQITKELVKASFSIDTARLNYLKVLQDIRNIVWTRDNIEQDLLAVAKTVASKLTDRKDFYKRPYIDAGKIIQTEYNNVFNPLNDEISVKAAQRKALADQIQQEQDKANAEIERLNNIRLSMIGFIQSVTNDISESTTDSQIVLIEKRVGTELSRKGFYSDYYEDFKAQCEELKPLIKKQKEYVKLLISLEKEKSDAMSKGNESAAVDARQKAEDIKEFIEEGKIRLQQKAFEQLENSDVAVGIPVNVAPDATRTTWKWRVDDVQLLLKKMPELVDLVPNKEKIDAILKESRVNGSFKGLRESKLYGITFYEDKSYK